MKALQLWVVLLLASNVAFSVAYFANGRPGYGFFFLFLAIINVVTLWLLEQAD